MSNQYVTLFDCLFIPQGLALYRSMVRHCKGFCLWVLCVDDETYETLSKLALEHIRLLRLSDWETPELLSLKRERTKAEYCWTLTPCSIRFVFESDPAIQCVTYIDADIWFRADPQQIFDEFEASKKHVLITEHGYAPALDQSYESGRYCVQFMTFTRAGGEIVRSWWEERCIKWCYARHEDGKFGDQKYLDDWPQRFKKLVHVLRDKALVMGPWSASRFPYSEAVIWHFHGLRLAIQNGRVGLIWKGGYALPRPTKARVYLPYIADLRDVIERQLSELGYSTRSQNTPCFLKRFLSVIRMYFR